MSNVDIRHFRTSEEFDTFVDSKVRPTWYSAIICHHTWRPTVAQWRGKPTLLGILNYYNGLGWTRYPHIFIAPDGIWTMNKLQEQGIHANAANPFGIAVEVVGDYDNVVWQEPIRTYALEAIVTLMEWGDISPDRILPHRLYNPAKTCPGKAIDMVWLRKEVTRIKIEKQHTTYRVITDVLNIRQGPSTTYPIAGKLYKGNTFISSVRKEDESDQVINGIKTWRHILRGEVNGQQIGGLGFVHEAYLQEL